ncbi:catabolite control protein A [Weissella confusa]|uniref:Catabolite control protein A n=1 Tax=Weissella confusa TaxID=1583 RepID=A0AAJ2YXI0_WEICO|nr:catabolite control protein A [Weissella confusa]NBA10901.1 catabolite control protein A [Weissella confusa]
MEKQTITIYDVAREAKVSMATVSRVVNGNANVKQETKEKVEAVIERLGYRPNAVARGLASRRTTTIGVVIPDVTDHYFAELARGIDDVAAMYHYQIILANSDESDTKELQVLENLLSKQVDGIIFMGNLIDDDIRKEFAKADVPIVLAGSVDDVTAQPSVNIDYTSAIGEATTKLLKNGHKWVAFVTGSLDHGINREYKLKGYMNALAVAGVDYDESLVIQGDYDYQSGYQMAEMVRDAKATAAVVVNDEMAAGLLNAMTDAGVKMPEDFELITNNNSKLAVMTRPQMSSITQPIYDLGAVAMRMLTKLMNREELAVKNIILPHSYVDRDSTKQ